MAFVLILLTLLVITGVFKYILHMRHLESYVKHLQIQEPVYPFFGNSLLLWGKTPTELFRELSAYVKKADAPFKSYLGPMLVVTIDKPEDIRTVLMSPDCLDRPYLYQFYPSKRGIFTATPSSIWRPIRKMMNPSFSLKILQSFLPIFNEKVGVLIEVLGNEVGKQPFDILPFMNACTLDMISATSMGYNFNVQRNQNREFLHSIEAFFDIVGERFMKFWTHSDFIYQWTDLYRQQQKHLDNLHKITSQIYSLKKQEYIAQNKHNVEEEKNEDDSYKKPQNLIDHLLRLVHDGKFDDEMAIEQVETVLIAGNETSSLQSAYTLLLLALHPAIQERLFDELRSVYESQDEPSTNEHFLHLPYLDRVIKESMRLFPPGAFMVRKTTVDVEISNCTVPKDSFITLAMYNLHRRRDIWGESADDFNPDNFLPENAMKRHPFSFIPFGGGPRNCIGYQYGMKAMKTMISAIIRHYKFTTNLKMSELEMRFAITLKLCNGHMVGIERRVW